MRLSMVLILISSLFSFCVFIFVEVRYLKKKKDDFLHSKKKKHYIHIVRHIEFFYM